MTADPVIAVEVRAVTKHDRVIAYDESVANPAEVFTAIERCADALRADLPQEGLA